MYKQTVGKPDPYIAPCPRQTQQNFRVTDLNSRVDARVVANTHGRTDRRTDRKPDPYFAPCLRQARKKKIIEPLVSSWSALLDLCYLSFI